MLYALALAALLGTCLPTVAQSGDPYATGVAQAAKELRQRRHDDFIERIEALSYAVGCKVVDIDHAWAAIFNSWFAQSAALGPLQPNLTREEMSAALNRNSELAKDRGCDFWKNNPDLVLGVRQSVAARRMP